MSKQGYFGFLNDRLVAPPSGICPMVIRLSLTLNQGYGAGYDLSFGGLKCLAGRGLWLVISRDGLLSFSTERPDLCLRKDPVYVKKDGTNKFNLLEEYEVQAARKLLPTGIANFTVDVITDDDKDVTFAVKAK